MKKMNKIFAMAIAICTLTLVGCGASNANTTVVDNNNSTVVVQEDELVKPEPEKETVEEPTPVVENTDEEDSSTETVAETEVDPEDQEYVDFDSWVDSIVNDNSIKVLPGILIWNADTNKHEIINYIYQELEEGDEVYVTTDDVKEIICNGNLVYDPEFEDEYFNARFNGALYIELENIKFDDVNKIEVKFYSEKDVVYVWELE